MFGLVRQQHGRLCPLGSLSSSSPLSSASTSASTSGAASASTSPLSRSIPSSAKLSSILSTPVEAVTFKDVGARLRVVENLQRVFDIVHPTRMQAALLPALMSHRDVVLKDETGTGKSFGILVAVLSKRVPKIYLPAAESSHPDATVKPKRMRYVANIIVAPTPELAVQYHSWAVSLLRGIDPDDIPKHVQVLLPQADTHPAAANLLSSMTPTTLIGTPRRLVDVIIGATSPAAEASPAKVDISRLQSLVLDETDVLVRVPSRFETLRERANRLKHPLHSEILVDAIIRQRRPASVGGSIGSKEKRTVNTADGKSTAKSKTIGEKPESEKLFKDSGNPATDAALARRLQVILCSATMNNPVRRELERMRGWIVDPILLDINGAHSIPSSIEHYCLVVGRRGVGLRNIWSKEEQDRVHRETQERINKLHAESAARKSTGSDSSPEALAAKITDPVWVAKMQHPALEDDHPTMMSIVAEICRKDSVERGILFLNSNISCSRVIDQLKKLGVSAGRVLEDVNLNSWASPYTRPGTGGHSSATKQIDHESDSEDLDDIDDFQEIDASNEGISSIMSADRFFGTGRDAKQLMVLHEHNARGLDLPVVSHVFMVGPPSSPASYLHMSGRVGRFGRMGKSYTILGGERYERRMGDMLTILGISPKADSLVVTE